MANVTITVNRSDLFPIGTVVKAYAAAGRKFGGSPSGALLAEGTVGATGKLEVSVPERTKMVLYAFVEEKHRNLTVGNPEDPQLGFTGTLKQRLRRRRVLAGA
jgi:hypothetical protein